MFKRLAALTALALCLCGAARADGALCVVSPHAVTLTDARGAELIPCGAVEEIFTVRENALYAAGSPGAYRLYDAGGVALDDVEFAMIHDAGEALIYRSAGLYGAMNAAGEALLSPEWTALVCDGGGGWLALDTDPLDERPDEIVHLDARGAARRTGVYTASGLAPVRCGRMCYMAVNGLFGATDALGEPVIEPEWRGMCGFEAGLAKVSGPEGFGLIDAEGRVVLAPVCRWLLRSDAMIAAGSEEGLEVFAPNGGEPRFVLPGGETEAGLAGECLWVSYADRTRLYDAQGNLLLEGDAALRFFPGTQGQLIAVDGAWGEACQWLVNPDGSTASGRFQQLIPLCEGRYAYLEMEGIEYYSDDLHELQKSWDYRDMRYGVADEEGRRITGAVYREVRALGGDRLLLVSDDRTALADAQCRELKAWVRAEPGAASGEAGA